MKVLCIEDIWVGKAPEVFHLETYHVIDVVIERIAWWKFWQKPIAWFELKEHRGFLYSTGGFIPIESDDKHDQNPVRNKKKGNYTQMHAMLQKPKTIYIL